MSQAVHRAGHAVEDLQVSDDPVALDRDEQPLDEVAVVDRQRGQLREQELFVGDFGLPLADLVDVPEELRVGLDSLLQEVGHLGAVRLVVQQLSPW